MKYKYNMKKAMKRKRKCHSTYHFLTSVKVLLLREYHLQQGAGQK